MTLKGVSFFSFIAPPYAIPGTCVLLSPYGTPRTNPQLSPNFKTKGTADEMDAA